MATARVTVPSDDTSAARETLTSRTGNGQSELVRLALTFDAANVLGGIVTAIVIRFGDRLLLTVPEDR